MRGLSVLCGSVIGVGRAMIADNAAGHPESEYNELVRQLADPAVVRAFWEGERPVNWPDAVPFPSVVVVLSKDWVQERREELGLSTRR
jgi:hypothetical protein